MGRIVNATAKRGRSAVVFIVAVAVLLAGSFFGYRFYRKNHHEPPPLESPARGDLEVRFKDSGDVAPKVFVDVASKVSGRIIELKVEEGELVRKGQPLAVIQPGRTESERYVPSTVLAPISGAVMRYVGQSGSGSFPRVGDYVTGLFDSQSPTTLVTVADLSRIVVKMQISEMDILKISPGMPVTVTVDAIEEKSFPARVSLISPQAEKSASGLKVFKVEVELAESEARLKPGMTARVDALLARKKGVLKVPLSAVFEEGGRPVVYREDPSGVPQRLGVELGLRSDLEAEVLGPESLSEKDRLRAEKPQAQARK